MLQGKVETIAFGLFVPLFFIVSGARLDAMAQERDNLRTEIAQLRKSLESVQNKHDEDVSGLREELDEAQSSKESAESQYRNLLGKVNTIRSQLGERLKADAVCLTGHSCRVPPFGSSAAPLTPSAGRARASTRKD